MKGEQVAPVSFVLTPKDYPKGLYIASSKSRIYRLEEIDISEKGDS